MQHAEVLLELAGIRVDGRRPLELREIKIRPHVNSDEGDGTAYLEQGLNKVLITIHGPQVVILK